MFERNEIVFPARAGMNRMKPSRRHSQDACSPPARG